MKNNLKHTKINLCVITITNVQVQSGNVAVLYMIFFCCLCTSVFILSIATVVFGVVVMLCN